MKMLVAAVALATAAFTAAAGTADWYQLGPDAKGIQWAIDRNSISRDKVSGVLEVVINQTYPTPQIGKNGTAYTQLNMVNFINCNNHQYTNAQLIYFSGLVKVGESKWELDPWQAALPGTVSMNIINAVCGSGDSI
jgi:hypothetical protein